MTAKPPRHRLTWEVARRLWRRRINRNQLAIALSIAIPALALFAGLGLFYLHYAKLTDALLRTGAFQDATDVYASPVTLSVGDTFTTEELAVILEQTGYSENSAGKPGTFRRVTGTVDAFFASGADPGRVRLTLAGDQRISRIELNGGESSTWTAGTPLVATLSSSRNSLEGKGDREKRHMVRFGEIPQVLIDAVTSIEDRHFFEHHGVDLPRILKASWIDLRENNKRQGGSTVTMQLVRGLWLQPQKSWSRKWSEVMMTIHLERKWSKEKIFEAYANQVYLGRQSAYGVHGFAEGSRMFFQKGLSDLSPAEAALLAGLVQRPSYFNPYRHPERARDRRNLVLALMRDGGRITNAQYQEAVATPVTMAGPLERDDSYGTPYFLDLVTDELQRQREENGSEAEGARQVYTTLDLSLQQAAGEAIAGGMKNVDALLASRAGNGGGAGKAEVALIALDPHTGEIKALVGGRNYARSQLNRVLANRPPGSIFKPFVYAAAINSGLSGGDNAMTAASLIDDSPATFWFGGKPYMPSNFHQESYGTITLRQALAKSDNIAAVKVAQRIGYGSVVAMARRAGLNDEIRATPSVALGSYAVTPLEMARAWTMFANGGNLVRPVMVTRVLNGSGESLQSDPSESHQALDPRVAYVMVGMLQEVMRSGTAAGVRSRGFTLPAAGKTGTSHDGWFAGFTSQLLCLVWVGFDDYRELNLEGAKSALPIWTEFMKKASKLATYRNAVEFPQPSGVSTVSICHESGKVAGEFCTDTHKEIFVSGTEPQSQCDSHAMMRTAAIVNSPTF